jgi:hypothetical protein
MGRSGIPRKILRTEVMWVLQALWKFGTYIWPIVQGVAAVECPMEFCLWAIRSGHDNCYSSNLPSARIYKYARR